MQLRAAAGERLPSLRTLTGDEARALVQTVAGWQAEFQASLGSRFVFLGDEVYLQAQAGVPPADAYEGFTIAEDGIGLVRRFEDEFDVVVVGGCGHVGLPLGIALAGADLQVRAYDISQPAVASAIAATHARCAALRSGPRSQVSAGKRCGGHQRQHRYRQCQARVRSRCRSRSSSATATAWSRS